jgi:hypothetical protein
MQLIQAVLPLKEPEVSFTQRPSFGKVPGYLERNKARIMAEKAAVQEYLRMRQQVDRLCAHPWHVFPA